MNIFLIVLLVILQIMLTSLLTIFVLAIIGKCFEEPATIWTVLVEAIGI